VQIESDRVIAKDVYKCLLQIDSICDSLQIRYINTDSAIKYLLNFPTPESHTVLNDYLSEEERKYFQNPISSNDSLLYRTKVVLLKSMLFEKLAMGLRAHCFCFGPKEATYLTCGDKGIITLHNNICEGIDSLIIDIAHPQFKEDVIPKSYKPLHYWTSKSNIFIETEPLSDEDLKFEVAYDVKIYTQSGRINFTDSKVEFELDRRSNRLKY
jgi:hypothetical protein